MTQRTDDLRIGAIEPIAPPIEILQAFPANGAAIATVVKARQALRAILQGADRRLAIIVGPCSIHDPLAALDYAQRLARARTRFGTALELVMRVYFEKPRTTVGWKGLINDPDLDGGCNIDKGLRMARELLCRINELGVPAACEFLDTTTPQYTADLVSWAAIGARTTESQIHRELASGLSCPVGFKNGTDGNLQIAVDAVVSASHPHRFLAVTKEGRAAVASTVGNEDGHVILRGGRVPNYDSRHVEEAAEALLRAGQRPAIVIDASHGNSGKRPERQPVVIDDICLQLRTGEERIVGVMIESNLQAGRQDLQPGRPLRYGQSITDGCIDWSQTEELLQRLSEAVAGRRELLALRRPRPVTGPNPIELDAAREAAAAS